MTNPQNSRKDLYAGVTRAIIAELEAGVRPWTQPWSAGAGQVSRPLRANGQPYSGINVLLLWSEAIAQGYTAPTWITYRQALALGAHVRKGARGASVVYANRITKPARESEDDETAQSIPFLKVYTVFNVEQVMDLPPAFYAPAPAGLDAAQRIVAAERFFAALDADIRHGGASAFYAVDADHVQMPPFAVFDDPQAYYATLAHECVHWTRHAGRLNRDFGRRRWGDEGYACEELVAELGAAFLCADLGLALEPRSDHASYLAGWLKVLQQDHRFIFTAAAHAQRACDYLHALQPSATSADCA